MQDLNDYIPELKIKLLNDGKGEALILLTQDDHGDAYSLAIHPIHLRYLAEKTGLIEASAPQIAKTIATLTRRIHLLNSRIQHLDHWLRTLSDTNRADLTYEIGFSGGTADMAAEFCAELDDVGAPSVQGAAIEQTTCEPDAKRKAKPVPAATPQAPLI